MSSSAILSNQPSNNTMAKPQHNDRLILDFPRHPRNTPKPRVTFDNQIEMKFVEALRYTPSKPDLWYNKKEMDGFKLQAAFLMRKIRDVNMSMVEFAEANATGRQDTVAFLGLENFLSKKIPEQVKAKRRELQRVVWHEQRRQIPEGVHDTERLAKICEGVTEWSQWRAQIIGQLHFTERR